MSQMSVSYRVPKTTALEDQNGDEIQLTLLINMLKTQELFELF